MRIIERTFRSGDHRHMFMVIRDTDKRESEVWFATTQGIMLHLRTYTHARDAAQKASRLADIVDTLDSNDAWHEAVQS